jgi:DNA-binding CsgD family transcriptional regulator
MTDLRARRVRSLTTTDIAILNQIAMGSSASAAADRVGITYEDIADQLEAIRLKLGVDSTAAEVLLLPGTARPV